MDASKASGPDCIPVLVLKNCEPEFSCILAQLYVPEGIVFSRLLNAGRRSTVKNYHPVSIFFCG